MKKYKVFMKLEKSAMAWKVQVQMTQLQQLAYWSLNSSTGGGVLGNRHGICRRDLGADGRIRQRLRLVLGNLLFRPEWLRKQSIYLHCRCERERSNKNEIVKWQIWFSTDSETLEKTFSWRSVLMVKIRNGEAGEDEMVGSWAQEEEGWCSP